MKCSCCGRRKRVFESFENIDYLNNKMNICGSCSGLVYAIRGAIREKDEKAIAELYNEICKKKES